MTFKDLQKTEAFQETESWIEYTCGAVESSVPMEHFEKLMKLIKKALSERKTI